MVTIPSNSPNSHWTHLTLALSINTLIFFFSKTISYLINWVVFKRNAQIIHLNFISEILWPIPLMAGYEWVYIVIRKHGTYRKKNVSRYIILRVNIFLLFFVFYNNREIDQWNMAFPCNVFPTEKTLRHQCQSCFGNLFLKYFLFKNILK